MTLLLIEVDTQKINKFPVERVPEQLDSILRPQHVKWSHGNYYVVEEGFDAKEAVLGAMMALNGTPWLRNAVQIQVVRCVVQKKLAEIDISGMSEPAPDKLEQYRRLFKNKELSIHRPAFPNPIVINEDCVLIDGYATYLIMLERGMKEAACILISED